MKKIKFLAIAMVMALMLMGVGYAWWSDSLTATATINTGVFEVDYKAANCTVTYDAAANNQFGGAMVPQPVAPAFTPADDSMTVTLDNLYPGASGTITLYMENTGTVPAELIHAAIAPTDAFAGNGSVLADYILLGDAQYQLYDKDGVADAGGPVALLSDKYLKDLQAEFDGQLEGIELDANNYNAAAPGAGIEITIPWSFDNTASDTLATVGADQFEDDSLELDFTFNWQQWNAQ